MKRVHFGGQLRDTSYLTNIGQVVDLWQAENPQFKRGYLSPQDIQTMDKNIKQYAKDNHLDYGTSAGQLYMLDGKAQANAERTLQSFQAVKDREQQAQQQRECMVNRNNPFDKCGQFWKDFGVGVSTGADAIARVGSLATKIPGVKDVPGVKEVIAGADALKGESVLDQGLKQLTGGLLAPTNRPRINARLQAVGLLPIPPLL